jgi:hypothetical protein
MKNSPKRFITLTNITWFFTTFIPGIGWYFTISDFPKFTFLQNSIFLNFSFFNSKGMIWFLLPVLYLIVWIILHKINKRKFEKKLEEDFSIVFHKHWDMRKEIIYGVHNVDPIKKKKMNRMIDDLLDKNYNKETVQYAFDKYYNDYIHKFITVTQD